MRSDRREPGSAEDDRGCWTGNERDLLISAATLPPTGLRAAKTSRQGIRSRNRHVVDRYRHGGLFRSEPWRLPSPYGDSATTRIATRSWLQASGGSRMTKAWGWRVGSKARGITPHTNARLESIAHLKAAVAVSARSHWPKDSRAQQSQMPSPHFQ